MDATSNHRYQAFRGSSDDITNETPLWRYLTFEKFCSIIETSTLYHARLDQFRDPFEGAVTEAYARKRDAGEIEPYFSMKEHEPWIFKALRLRQFATCWHASAHESDAQWQLYAPGGAGIAIVSSIARIERSVDIAPYPHGILGQVEYVDFDNHDMKRARSGTVIRPGHLKRKSFEHEKEVRGIILAKLIWDGPTVALDESSLEMQRTKQPHGIAAKVDLKEIVASIVLSPTIASFVAELVHIVTKRHGLEHLVRKSDLAKMPSY